MLQYNKHRPADVGVPFHVERDDTKSHAYLAIAEAVAAERNSSSFDLLLSTLEGLGYGGVLLGPSDALLSFNQTALNTLESGSDSLHASSGQRSFVRASVAALLKQCRAGASPTESSWSTVLCETGRPLALMQLPDKAGTGNILVILVDLDCAMQPNPQVLRQLFSLTAAETKVAQRVALGRAPAEIASELSLSRNTIRSQIASIMAKTHTKRQAELVVLLARVSILPHLTG